MKVRSGSELPRTDTERRKVRILWLDPVESRWSDVIRVVRHPVTALLCGLLLALIFFANRSVQAEQVSVLFRLAVYSASPVVALAIVVGWMALRFLLVPPRDGIVDLTLPVIAAVAFVVPVNQYVQSLYIDNEVFSWLRLGLRVLFYSVVGLGITVALVCFLAPRVIEPVAEGAMPPDSVTLAGRAFVTADLVKLEARGNRVLATCRYEETMLPGPLADRVADLPPTLGRLVHRSVWVREGAVTGHRRDGRDIVIDLEGGHSTVAAASRHAELLPWLQALARDRGAAGQDGQA